MKGKIMKVKIRIPESNSGDLDQYTYNGLTGYFKCGKYKFDDYDPSDRIYIELTEKSKEKIKEYNKQSGYSYRYDPGIYKKYLVKISGNVVISNE
jgi:hypothetical protein